MSMMQRVSDIKELPCNAPSVVHIRNAKNAITAASVTNLAYSWNLYAADSDGLPTGSAIATGDSVNQTGGYYTITITKAQSETMTKGSQYVLDVDEDGGSDGGTALVTAVWA